MYVYTYIYMAPPRNAGVSETRQVSDVSVWRKGPGSRALKS